MAFFFIKILPYEGGYVLLMAPETLSPKFNPQTGSLKVCYIGMASSSSKF